MAYDIRKARNVAPIINGTCADALLSVLDYYFDDSETLSEPTADEEKAVLSFAKNLRNNLNELKEYRAKIAR